MKKLPIGIQEFRKLREGGFVYVDKTESLYPLVKGSGYYFLSRPRRFGKSLLVNTLKEIFLGSEELFEGLWIKERW
ncbi:MAG: AAA family ATPase, partial [Cytophagales bacterium]|nr:AAA family ATPase [Cytophagales bacterium]